MGFSEAVQWWEEWQLRVLVLGSLFVQYFLYFAAPLRKRNITSWFRFIIWLAYLGSDALAIYALAALFNRHKKEEWISAHREDASLEALWAPILLVHLGGVDSITAYNIEDNELWRRHVLTSVSQAAVAIYVFRKSWTTGAGDMRLLQSAILIFLAGILKCFAKPVALKSASINNLMNIVRSSSSPETGVPLDNLTRHDVEDELMKEVPDIVVNDELYYPFLDMAPRRFVEGYEHEDLQRALSLSFDRLYTKEQVYSHTTKLIMYMIFSKRVPWRRICGFLLRMMVNPMIFAALGLFHTSQKGDYNSVDVKVTYTLLSCTASLEYFGGFWLFVGHCICGVYNAVANGRIPTHTPWPDHVAQYSLVGYLASKRKHKSLMSITAFLGCEDYLDPLWCMKPFEWSMFITWLVSRFVEIWKRDHGSEGDSNTNMTFKFNDNRGHWTLKKQGCGGNNILWESLRRPFDESVLLWHLATEFFCFDRLDDTGSNDDALCHVATCYFARWDDTGGKDNSNDNTGGNNSSNDNTGDDDSIDNDTLAHIRISTVISNYMAYLLFVNPEMLMTGTRPSLFRNAYKRLNGMMLDDGEERTALAEKDLAKKIIQELKGGAKGRGIVDDAWAIYVELMKLCNDDNDKMWTVIFGVWVEMLCFSASRCRGYLHAKSLGKGGEYLSYIWLLLWRMGMETLTDKMQRASDLPDQEDDNASGGGVEFTGTTSTTPAEAIIGDKNEKAELQEVEGSNDRAACTASATTIISDEKRDEDGGSHGATSATAATPIIGDENV